nr:translation initiation factor IF-2-like [Saimiri boliviensis boliviensis]
MTRSGTISPTIAVSRFNLEGASNTCWSPPAGPSLHHAVRAQVPAPRCAGHGAAAPLGIRQRAPLQQLAGLGAERLRELGQLLALGPARRRELRPGAGFPPPRETAGAEGTGRPPRTICRPGAGRRASSERRGERRARPARSAPETPRAPRVLASCDPPRVLLAGPGLRSPLAEPLRSPPRKLGKRRRGCGEWRGDGLDFPFAPKRLPVPGSLGFSSFIMNLAQGWL